MNEVTFTSCVILPTGFRKKISPGKTLNHNSINKKIKSF